MKNFIQITVGIFTPIFLILGTFFLLDKLSTGDTPIFKGLFPVYILFISQIVYFILGLLFFKKHKTFKKTFFLTFITIFIFYTVLTIDLFFIPEFKSKTEAKHKKNELLRKREFDALLKDSLSRQKYEDKLIDTTLFEYQVNGLFQNANLENYTEIVLSVSRSEHESYSDCDWYFNNEFELIKHYCVWDGESWSGMILNEFYDNNLIFSIDSTFDNAVLESYTYMHYRLSPFKGIKYSKSKNEFNKLLISEKDYRKKEAKLLDELNSIYQQLGKIPLENCEYSGNQLKFTLSNNDTLNFFNNYSITYSIDSVLYNKKVRK